MPAPDPITQQAPPPAPPAGSEPPPSGDAAPPANKPVRPEGLADAYWNDETGVAFDKLVPDLTALTTFKAEADSRAAQVPDKLEEYEVGLPEGFEAPEGFEFNIVEDHPLLAPAREFAKAAGLNRDQFKQLVSLQARAQIAEAEQLKAGVGAEMAKLGTKATARIDALTNALQAKLGNELANVLLPMMFSAKQIEAFEKLVSLANAGGPKLTATGRETEQPQGITDDAWNSMSPSQRIAKGRELDAQRKTAA